MKALVAGAGVGGLAVALALARAGVEVRVSERSPALAEVGAGVQLSPNAVKPLDALGLGEALRAVADAPEALELRHGGAGARIFRLPMGEAAESRFGAPYLHAMRADLVEVLRGALAAAAPQALRLNEAVASHVEDASGVRVGLDTGEVVRADVLIGADGLRSGVRERLFGPERPRYTGCVAWRALVEAGRIEGPPVPAAAAVWTGPGRHVVTYPVRRGRVVNLVGVEERGVWRREGWMNAGDCAAMRSAFAGFAAPVTAALAAATSCGLWAIYDRDPPERWVKGRVALLGDACHPMPPYLAQGAAMAIEDAFVLARELIAGAADPAAALVRYEAARVKRVARVVRTARGNRGVFHRPGPISQLLTYGPMRAADLAAPGVVRSRLDWLYGHDVTAEPSA